MSQAEEIKVGFVQGGGGGGGVQLSPNDHNT